MIHANKSKADDPHSCHYLQLLIDGAIGKKEEPGKPVPSSSSFQVDEFLQLHSTMARIFPGQPRLSPGNTLILDLFFGWVLMQSDSPGANDSSNSHSACRLCSSLLLVLTEPCGTLNQMGRQRVFLSQWGSTRMKSGQPWLPLAVPWSLCLLLRNWTLAPLEVILHETNVPIQ